MLIMSFQHAYGQVNISKTEVDYSLSIEQDSVFHILTFWKR
jgi:hypothetical protein